MSLFLLTGKKFGFCEMRNATKILQVFMSCKDGSKGSTVVGQWMLFSFLAQSLLSLQHFLRVQFMLGVRVEFSKSHCFNISASWEVTGVSS